jgi:hypothetical protein
MAKNETRRLSPAVIQADKESLSALKTITGYSPANPEVVVSALDGIEQEMTIAQDAEAQAVAALSAARDVAAAAEWKYHNRIINMRDAVSGQYGRNSNEVQKVGRKKTSEFSPRRRKPPTS